MHFELGREQKPATFAHDGIFAFMKFVFVIIPCLNEETAIQNSIRQIRKCVPEAVIAVVDNGSTDRTVELALQEKVHVWHEPMQGKGYAVRHGLARIPNDCDVVFITDGDDTYSAEPITQALELVRSGGYDMIVGARKMVKAGSSDRGDAFRIGHTLGNKFLTGVFHTLFPVPITDAQSGWRVMSRGFARSFTGGASGFEIETELNAHAYLLKCAVKEIPVEYRGRGEESFSKLKTYSDGFRILRMNLKLFRAERPYAAFVITALPWTLLSAVLLFRSLSDYLDTGLVPRFPSLIASIGSFLVASLLWVTGMILERVRISREAIARTSYAAAFTELR